MSKTYISAEVRTLVRERAKRCCEYCLVHEDDVYFGCQVDHIISEKHGGKSKEDNLAYACIFCNRYKGSDLGSLAGENLVRFFNPRSDRWHEHFYLEGFYVRSQTTIGEVTERIFQFNHEDRLSERQALMKLEKYPRYQSN
jgi:HNH endonuclease